MSRAASAPAQRRGRTEKWLWLQGLGCGLLLTLATPTAVLAGVLLAPALLAAALDRAPGRPVARPLLLIGLAGAARPLATLWWMGHHMATAWDLLSDPAVMAAAWGGQALLWLAMELGPLFAMLAAEAAVAARAAHLRASRRHYEEQWGLPPGG
jgi:hypothetical protein